MKQFSYSPFLLAEGTLDQVQSTEEHKYKQLRKAIIENEDRMNALRHPLVTLSLCKRGFTYQRAHVKLNLLI